VPSAGDVALLEGIAGFEPVAPETRSAGLLNGGDRALVAPVLVSGDRGRVEAGAGCTC